MRVHPWWGESEKRQEAVRSRAVHGGPAPRRVAQSPVVPLGSRGPGPWTTAASRDDTDAAPERKSQPSAFLLSEVRAIL